MSRTCSRKGATKPQAVIIVAVIIIVLATSIYFYENPQSTPSPTPAPSSIPTPTPTPTPTPIPYTNNAHSLQERNNLPKNQLQTKHSKELTDNYIGGVSETRHITARAWHTGLKWMRVICDGYGRWQEIEWDKEEYTIDPEDDRIINDLLKNGIKIMLVLDVWHNENRTVFYKTEEDIECYLNYVRFVVHHFKSRIDYYEILNEPNNLPLPYYVDLIKQTVPVIREEDTYAKIVIGALPDTRFIDGFDYMWGLFRSEVMHLVDGFSWHPMYGATPSDDPRGVRQPELEQVANYWENYPSIVQEIKDEASTNGFEGEYIVEEMLWRTPSEPHETEPYGFTDTTAAKYYARAIIIHRGLNITTGLSVAPDDVRPKSYSIIQNLCTVMAGTMHENLSVEIKSEETNIQSYSFSLSNGDNLIALWTDGVAVDVDPGVITNVTIYGLTAQNVTGLDILYGFKQPLVVSNEDGNLLINNIIVRDYPLILRITKTN